MLHLEKTSYGYLHIVADSWLSPEDYDAFVPAFERELAARAGHIPMLIELGPDFSGWTAGGVLRDLKFDAEHADRFGRLAVVGDRRWEKWGIEASDPFFEAEMRFFERDDISAAEAWLREPVQGEKS